MKLKILLDNNTIIDRYFFGEPGVSFLIEDSGTKILFDVGYSDAFIKNAQKMGENLLDLDYLVFSHGHMDHTWGLDPLIKFYAEAKIEGLEYKIPNVIGHPLVFETKLLDGLGEIGSIVSEEKVSKHFDIKLSKNHIWITDKLVFLGEIERKNNFENKVPIGKVRINNEEQDDYIMDDTAIAYKGDEGLIIITGCSHAGICNIIEQAKKICNDDRIIDVIGGLHLLNPSKEQLDGTLEYLETIKPKYIHPCHCTDLNSKIAISKVANVKSVGSGLVLEYN